MLKRSKTSTKAINYKASRNCYVPVSSVCLDLSKVPLHTLKYINSFICLYPSIFWYKKLFFHCAPCMTPLPTCRSSLSNFSNILGNIPPCSSSAADTSVQIRTQSLRLFFRSKKIKSPEVQWTFSCKGQFCPCCGNSVCLRDSSFCSEKSFAFHVCC